MTKCLQGPGAVFASHGARWCDNLRPNRQIGSEFPFWSSSGTESLVLVLLLWNTTIHRVFFYGKLLKMPGLVAWSWQHGCVSTQEVTSRPCDVVAGRGTPAEDGDDATYRSRRTIHESSEKLLILRTISANSQSNRLLLGASVRQNDDGCNANSEHQQKSARDLCGEEGHHMKGARAASSPAPLSLFLVHSSKRKKPQLRFFLFSLVDNQTEKRSS